MNIKKTFRKFMMIVNLFFLFTLGNDASANEAMEDIYYTPGRNLITPEAYTFKISYYCENKACPTGLKSLAVSTSTGEEYESDFCRQRGELLFRRNGTGELGALLKITKSQLPFNLEIRWLSWICKLSSLKENIFNSASIPLEDWGTWGNTTPLIATLQPENLFDQYGRQEVSRIIIKSPTYGSPRTVLILEK